MNNINSSNNINNSDGKRKKKVFEFCVNDLEASFLRDDCLRLFEYEGIKVSQATHTTKQNTCENDKNMRFIHVLFGTNCCRCNVLFSLSLSVQTNKKRLVVNARSTDKTVKFMTLERSFSVFAEENCIALLNICLLLSFDLCRKLFGAFCFFFLRP
jgi:hypothetical protein